MNKKEKQCSMTCKASPCDECKNQKEKDEELHKRQTQRIEALIQMITESKQGRVGNVFMMKKQIAGPKKTSQECSAIRDPTSGELLVSKEDIKKATLLYCVENLKKNKPEDDVKDMVVKRKEEQLMKMKDKSGDTFKVTVEDFEEVLDKFNTKKTKTYDFLLKSGDKYKMAMFTLCKRIIDKEEIPDFFRTTVLHMIWKRKGPMEILKNNRFLHMKQVLARTVDAIVVTQMKQPLISKLSMYQVGGLPGHSTNEHLLTIKTVLNRLEQVLFSCSWTLCFFLTRKTCLIV